MQMDQEPGEFWKIEVKNVSSRNISPILFKNKQNHQMVLFILKWLLSICIFIRHLKHRLMCFKVEFVVHQNLSFSENRRTSLSLVCRDRCLSDPLCYFSPGGSNFSSHKVVFRFDTQWMSTDVPFVRLCCESAKSDTWGSCHCPLAPWVT